MGNRSVTLWCGVGYSRRGPRSPSGSWEATESRHAHLEVMGLHAPPHRRRVTPQGTPWCLPGHSSPSGLLAGREKWKPFSWDVAHRKDIMGLLQGLTESREKKGLGGPGLQVRGSPPGRETVLGNRITLSPRPRLQGLSSSPWRGEAGAGLPVLTVPRAAARSSLELSTGFPTANQSGVSNSASSLHSPALKPQGFSFG